MSLKWKLLYIVLSVERKLTILLYIVVVLSLGGCAIFVNMQRQTTIIIGYRGEAPVVINSIMDLSESSERSGKEKLSPLKIKKLHNMKKSENKGFRIRTNTEYGERSKGEVINGVSMTIPDEAYTIEEILDKFAKGITLDITHNGEYSDTEDFDDIDERTYLKDLTDIEDIEESMAARRQRRTAKAKKPTESATELAEKQAESDTKP